MLVDDIVDSGKTLERALKDLKGNDVTSVAIHVNDNPNAYPTFWLREPEDWVHYPWEI